MCSTVGGGGGGVAQYLGGYHEYRGGISIYMRVCFNFITDPAAEFHLFNPKNKDIYRLFKENIVGGPSIIFNRYHEAGKRFIRNDPNKTCQKIIGYDANALYLGP